MDNGPRVCSVARTLEVVGDRWSLLVIREAFLGNHRFDAIQRRTGAPRDILAARLRKLVETGVLERRRYHERPPRDEYHLTAAGRELHMLTEAFGRANVITALRQWGDRHVSRRPAPPRFAHACGGEGAAFLVCPDCGEPVEAGSYRREEEVRPARP